MIDMYNNHLAYTQQTIQELEGLIIVSGLLNGFAGAVESGDGPFQQKNNANMRILKTGKVGTQRGFPCVFFQPPSG